MTVIGKSLIALALISAGLVSAAYAADATAAGSADNRTKVATAVALANIATADKDGDALLVAARMLATSGPVAKAGEAVSDGKPTLYDVAAMAASAKEMGADAGKADEVAKMAAAPTAQARDGYWYYSCDSYNNCQWIYAGY
jgi:hypothetical protein